MGDNIIYYVPLIAVAFTIIIYVRNKQNDRARHRRERMKDKQEELLETLRKRNENQQADEN